MSMVIGGIILPSHGEIYKDFFTVEKKQCNDIINRINSTKLKVIDIKVNRDLLNQMAICYLHFIKDLEKKGA